jgi:glucose-1-phosphate adenylyltransferase
LFDGYWEDIGTVGAFLKANLDLNDTPASFEFATGDYTIFTRPRYLPCTRIADATVKSALLADGCVIGRGAVIENSVIGVRARIGDNSWITDSYIMGADIVELEADLAANEAAGRPDIGIGAGTVIRRAIVDKNARIGRNVRITNEAGIQESEDSPYFAIKDGVVVIPKFTLLADGTEI